MKIDFRQYRLYAFYIAIYVLFFLIGCIRSAFALDVTPLNLYDPTRPVNIKLHKAGRPDRTVSIYPYPATPEQVANYDGSNYHLPSQVATTVQAPDPTAVANGDATPKSVTLGAIGHISVPGGILTQLADGTWTNEGLTPSPDLQQAWQDAQHLADCSPPVPTATDPGYHQGDVVEAPKASYYGQLWIPSQTYKGKIYGSPTSQNFNCYNSIYFPNPGTLYYDGQSTGQLHIYVKTHVPGTCGINGSADIVYWTYPSSISTDALTYNPGGCGTPADKLPQALQPYMDNYPNGGLPDDIKKACERTGQCTSEPTPEQIDSGVDSWLSSNNTAVDTAISSGIASGASTGATDGSLNGAAQQQAGQLAGIQQALNGIKNDTEEMKDKMKEGKPDITNSGHVPYTLDEVNFGGRMSEFFTNIQNTGLFSVVHNLECSLPSGSSQWSYDFGSWGGVQVFDLSAYDSVWQILRGVFFTSFIFIATRIVVLKV